MCKILQYPFTPVLILRHLLQVGLELDRVRELVSDPELYLVLVLALALVLVLVLVSGLDLVLALALVFDLALDLFVLLVNLALLSLLYLD